MNQVTFKVGPKNRHVTIPQGWHRVMEGVVKEFDKFASTDTLQFHLVEEDDIGLPFDFFDLIIREDVTNRLKINRG